MDPSSPTGKRLRQRSDLTILVPQHKPSFTVILPLSPNSNSNSVPGPSSSSTSSAQVTIQQHHQSPLSIPELHRIDCLGRGSSSTVYKVKHRPTGNLYALKVVYVFQDSIRDQICRKIDILRSVHHPNVVKCHGMVQYGGEFQIILDYMDGGSLKGNHIFHEPSLADYARQILSGLAYLHRRQIVHQDIKPSNLLINNLKQVKIAEFGVSRILARGMDPGSSSVGTIAYMSPEKINCNFNDGTGVYDGYAADIWSLGVSILELYMGKFPIVNDHPGDLAGMKYSICESQLLEVWSREFSDFISCCLQKEAKRRWTAAQLLLHPFITRNNSNIKNSSKEVNQQQLPPLQDQPSSFASSTHAKLKSNL